MALANGIRVVGKEDLNRIHEATVQVLEEVGVELQLDEAIEIFKKHGATNDGKRVMIPRKMLEAAIESAPASFKLWGRDEAKSLTIGEDQTRTHVEPSNGPVFAQDADGGRRLGTMEDFINFIKLAHVSDVCDINGAIPVEPSDIDKNGRHLRIFYETLRHTDKPLRSNLGPLSEVQEMFDMFEIAKGQKGYLREHPCMYVSINPLSPLAYDGTPLKTMITYAEYGQPVTILTCALAGVSAPVNLMGASVLQNAEILAGLVLIQLVNPGSPFIYAPASAVPNMQTGAYITGSPESNLINITNLQLAREMYKIPTRTMAGLTDAKALDAQAGYETMQNLFQCMVGGADIVNECLGVVDSIMTNSFEKFVLDEEMMNRILRFMDGMKTSEEDLAVDVIKAVGPRGAYLMHPSTMMQCRNAWRPAVSTWDAYDKWESQGSEDVSARAGRKYKELLAEAPETTLDAAVDEELQAYMNARIQG